MDIAEIQELIKFVAKSGVSEVELELKDFKIIIKTPPRKKRGNGQQDEPEVIQTQVPIAVIPQNQVVIAAPAEAPPSTEKKEEEEKEEDDSKTIKSPMIGTFYRSSDPEKPPFVNVGDDIEKGQVICIIEAMKLFNEIESEVSGKIVKILVDDNTPVEYDQPLFLIELH